MSAPDLHPIDVEASALLVAVLEGEGGDLKAAFAVLCARVTVEDVTGETFQGALSRAVAGLLGQTRHALHGITDAAPEPPEGA